MYHITANTQRNHARKLVENCPENLNPHEAIAVAFMTMPAEHWQMYMRYDTTISRDFFKTLDALQKLQRTRENRKPAVGQALSPGLPDSKSCMLARHTPPPNCPNPGLGPFRKMTPTAASDTSNEVSAHPDSGAQAPPDHAVVSPIGIPNCDELLQPGAPPLGRQIHHDAVPSVHRSAG